MKISTTTTTQTGNELLGKKDSTLYYVILENGDKKVIINVGEKTYKNVNELTQDGTSKNKMVK